MADGDIYLSSWVFGERFDQEFTVIPKRLERRSMNERTEERVHLISHT